MTWTLKPIMKKPREQRMPVTLRVRIWGMDATGKLFDIEAQTVDITPVGAKIEGCLPPLERGAVIGVQCGQSRARFRIVWVREHRTASHAGIRCVEPGKYIWGLALQRKMEELTTPHEPAVLFPSLARSF